MRKSNKTIANTKHQEDKQSKAISSLFPIKMIAKLERVQRNVKQSIEQKHRTPQLKQQLTTNQQQQQNRHLISGIILSHLGWRGA